MSQNSGDVRVRRTQNLLREALITLIEERSFDAITVGDIAKRATVSRATFYRYYRDKYDFVEKIFAEVLATIVGDMEPFRRDVISHFDSHPTSNVWVELFGGGVEWQPTPEPWVKMFEYFAQYERLYRALLGKRGSSWFVTTMRTSIAEAVTERFQALAYALNSQRIAESRVIADGFVPALVAAQLMDAIIWWLEQGRPYSPTQIATYYFRLMCSTFREVIAWE